MTEPLPEPSLERLTALLQEAGTQKADLLAACPAEPNETPAEHKKRVGSALLVAAAYRAGMEDMQARVLPIQVALQMLGTVVRTVLRENGLSVPARMFLQTTMTLLESKVGKDALSSPQKAAPAP